MLQFMNLQINLIMSLKDNIERIKIVHRCLGDLQNQIVYVGGATISLYADREPYEVRETDDIDVIVEIANYPEQTRFDELLLSKGFTNDIESKVRCRYKVNGITVDVIPTEDISMGFKNYWYPEGFKNAINHKIDEQTNIKILTAPYFIATKLEAFNDRGRTEGRTSQDFEDIVYVFENRSVIWDEMRNAKENLRKYLVKEFTGLLSIPNIREWIECHADLISPPSVYWILEELRQLINS